MILFTINVSEVIFVDRFIPKQYKNEPVTIRVSEDTLVKLDALEHMLLESGVKMFEYGMKYGQKQE